MLDARIKAFFDKKCTPREAEEVSQFLKANPAELARWLPESEWHSSTGTPVNEEVWAGMWEKIELSRRYTLKRNWQRIAVAALITGISFGSYRLLTPPQVEPAVVVIDHEPPAVSSEQVIVNSQDKKLGVDLPDGSRVSLEPGSTLHFTAPFLIGPRKLYLTGTGFFSVAPDKQRPFTVFAGNFSTTALGTEFRVDMTAGNGIIVQLMRGKVVIRSSSTLVKGWKNDIFLAPGESMSYDGLLAKTSVKIIRPSPSGSGRHTTTARFEETADGLNFHGETLAAALDRMSAYFRVPVDYDTPAVRGMHFSGEINRKDSLPMVLRVIAQMNHLRVDSSEGHYNLKR